MSNSDSSPLSSLLGTLNTVSSSMSLEPYDLYGAAVAVARIQV